MVSHSHLENDTNFQEKLSQCFTKFINTHGINCLFKITYTQLCIYRGSIVVPTAVSFIGVKKLLFSSIRFADSLVIIFAVKTIRVFFCFFVMYKITTSKVVKIVFLLFILQQLLKKFFFVP